jgi:predicted GNAT family acetyltransferase
MNINQIEEGNRGYFVATENSVEVGRITYVMAGPTKLVIEHTEVNPTYEGNGIGKKLVFATVDYARENNLKILPLCTFAKALFDKTPEIHDVLF